MDDSNMAAAQDNKQEKNPAPLVLVRIYDGSPMGQRLPGGLPRYAMKPDFELLRISAYPSWNDYWADIGWREPLKASQFVAYFFLSCKAPGRNAED
jgi:hypothetical protein